MLTLTFYDEVINYYMVLLYKENYCYAIEYKDSIEEANRARNKILRLCEVFNIEDIRVEII